ncbi:MAG: CehA/McbA family metallohydrolase [Planctomycetes bacterium]|nr:CehA/McbA family metallohydrolase [Planctomycetota bacterium]MCP4770645.1 CehA/McbA family metallohydrolase [Planctomycetota bacterium]MCP4861028.1 CehA/McbA family metallohydrolase [Planctomycetota bacterium]
MSPVLLLGALSVGWFLPQEPQAPQPQQEAGTTILTEVLHLGNDETPEWPEAAAAPDAANSYEFHFEARAGSKERALEITSRHVNDSWKVELNGKLLTTLKTGDPRVMTVYPLPVGFLVDGDNVMRVSQSRISDDITFGPVRLLDRGIGEIHQVAPLRVKVTDAETGAPLPARITVVDENDELAPMYFADRHHTPVRTGFAYTDAHGEALLQLGAGKHTIYASRGPEWSYSEVSLTHAYQSESSVELSLRHEVNTNGWVSADTHIHTLTFSGHGDSSLEERILTLAGEGLDVAIATDHNHHTDYSAAQKEAGLLGSYLSIVGNEVTTDIGHFNAFPYTVDGPLPDAKIIDWYELDKEMRAKGAEVVILNHPRWPDVQRGPFGVSNLDARTGYFEDGLKLPVDAIEVFNSTDPGTDWDVIVADWFSLLNAGSMVRGVGSSDSHTVGDPVGQGRTWLRSSTDTPSQIDTAELYRHFRDGVSSMAIGLFGWANVQGQASGSLVTPKDGELSIQFHIAGASWADVDAAKVYMNGVVVAQSETMHRKEDEPLDTNVWFTIPAPKHDAWLVCGIRGPNPKGVWRYTLMPGLVLMTNPVWIDADGDGKYTSPAATAKLHLDEVVIDAERGPQIHTLAKLMSTCDSAIAVQVMAQAKQRWGADYPDKLELIASLSSRYKARLLDLLD